MDFEIPISVSAVHCTEPKPLSSPEYLLVLALSDGITLQGVEETALPAGALLFLSPFSGRRLRLPAGGDALYAVIPAAFLEPLIGIPKRASLVMMQEGNDTVREKLIELFDRCYNQSPKNQLLVGRTAYELLCALAPSITSEGGTEQNDETESRRSTRMQLYLEEHFREPVSLGDLADAFSMSRQHISTTFHRELGTPFSEYLTKLRLEEALRLLLTTDLGITEIAIQSGFPNIKSFNQAFREKHGTSPKEFRKQRAASQETAVQTPTGAVLRDMNQLLRPYRLVYQKHEDAVRVETELQADAGKPWTPHWDILNIDNSADCLHQTAQIAIARMQERLGFRYARLANITGSDLIPFIPATMRHRFTHFIQLMEFIRSIGLTPMLVFGTDHEIMLNSMLVGDEGYSINLDEWEVFLQQLLTMSIQRWGTAWVDTWRFEFHMPEQLFGGDTTDGFFTLYERSVSQIRALLPNAEIGGPALPMDAEHQEFWDAWFSHIKPEDVDFVSVELWAESTEQVEMLAGPRQEPKAVHTLTSIRNAEAALVVQKVQRLRQRMKDTGLEQAKLYVSALGITKYRSTAAQVGGHCAAHLVKTNLELTDLTDGIGCWKALNGEAEYADENQVISQGCGMFSRNSLKNIQYYAYDFLMALLPSRISQGLHSIATTDGSGQFVILLHNCKDYSAYFCRHYLDRKGIDFSDSKHYISTAALEHTMTIRGVTSETYLARQFLIGDHHGCIASVLSSLGEARILDKTEIEYVAGQSLPYIHAFRLTAQDEKLRFQVTLQPNEVMLLILTPGDSKFYDIQPDT